MNSGKSAPKGWAALLLATLLWCAALVAVLAVERQAAAEDAELEPAPVSVTQQAEIKPTPTTGPSVHTPIPATPEPSPTPAVLAVESAVATETVPTVVPRYAGVTMTDAEREELAAVVWLEAGNQCARGQQAVVEVVFNRVISPDFPNTVHKVLHQRGQFSTARNISRAQVGQAQYDAIDAALYGPSILPKDVVFFSTQGENDRVWGRIEDHVFCYGYVWD